MAVGELRGGRLLHHDDVVAVGVAQHEQERRAGRAHRLRIDSDAADGAQTRVLAQDVRRLARNSCDLLRIHLVSRAWHGGSFSS